MYLAKNGGEQNNLVVGSAKECQRCAKNTHGQVGREKDKRKTKRAPGGMKTKNGDRKLDQIVTGGDHQQMK